jgi:hypothetical protein
MISVILEAISSRAKNRIREHGSEMRLLEERVDKVLVESLDLTWRGQKWMGWFTKEEVKFHVCDNSVP